VQRQVLQEPVSSACELAPATWHRVYYLAPHWRDPPYSFSFG
jgi:hypothetical protein